MTMEPENVDRAIAKALKLLEEAGHLGDRTGVIEEIRAYAKGDGDATGGAWLAYRLGGAEVHESIDAINILLSLINLRAPGATDSDKKVAREHAYPSMWDYLSDEG